MHSASLIFLAGLASALPTTSNINKIEERQYTGSTVCYDGSRYEVASTKERIGDFTAVSGDTCTSSTNDGCSVGQTNSISIGVSITAGASLDIGEIFSVDSSITYTTTTTTAQTVTQMCPKGGYVCGLMYKPTWVDVTGKKIGTYTGTCVLAGKDTGKSEDYAFSSPLLIGGKPAVRYAVCISNQSPNMDTGSVGVDLCPNGL